MAGMAMSLRVVVPPHPLIAHWLTVLRDGSTPSPLVATAMAELGRWLTYEALRDWLPQRTVPVQTPLAATEGTVVDPSAPLLAVVQVPAALGVWDGARPVLPAAAVAHMVPATEAPGQPGPGWALDGLPAQIGERVGVLVLVPQIATGRTLLALLERLGELGVAGARVRVVTALAAAPGLQLLGERMPELTVYCACIDPEVDGEGQVRPGFGDATLRLTGIKTRTCLG
jgi:uracil phosphoribosyltransferase